MFTSRATDNRLSILSLLRVVVFSWSIYTYIHTYIYVYKKEKKPKWEERERRKRGERRISLSLVEFKRSIRNYERVILYVVSYSAS